jgi:hypothetical protein
VAVAVALAIGVGVETLSSAVGVAAWTARGVGSSVVLGVVLGIVEGAAVMLVDLVVLVAAGAESATGAG